MEMMLIAKACDRIGCDKRNDEQSASTSLVCEISESALETKIGGEKERTKAVFLNTSAGNDLMIRARFTRDEETKILRKSGWTMTQVVITYCNVCYGGKIKCLSATHFQSTFWWRTADGN